MRVTRIYVNLREVYTKFTRKLFEFRWGVW